MDTAKSGHRHVRSGGSGNYPIFEVSSAMDGKPEVFTTLTPPGTQTFVKPENQGCGKCKCCRKVMSWMDNPWAAEMCSDFSLHAMPRAFNPGSSHFRRGIWFILFLVGMIAGIFTVTDTMQDYFEYESMTLINTQRGGDDGILFPAVTIWNQNPISASAIHKTPFAEAMCGTPGGFNDGGVFSEKRLPEGWNDTMAMKVAHKFNDMMIDCQYQGYPCTSEDFFPSLTPYPNTRWGMSYTFNHRSNVKTRQPGRPGGLHLVLDVRSRDACAGIWDEGVRVQFHDHEDLPESVKVTHVNPMLGDTVSPGKRWSFSVKRVESEILSKPYSDHCIDLKAGEEYPNPNAARECAASCPGMKDEDITEIFLLTTSNQCVIKCFEGRNSRFCNGVTFPYFLGNSKLIAPYFSNTTQEIVDTLRKSPIRRFIPDNALNMTPSTLRSAVQTALEENIVVIDVFYRELIIEHHKQVPRQSFWASAGEAGGLIGLFLGASFITGFEFIEILLVLLCSCVEKKTSHPQAPVVYQERSLELGANRPSMLQRYAKRSSWKHPSSEDVAKASHMPVVQF